VDVPVELTDAGDFDSNAGTTVVATTPNAKLSLTGSRCVSRESSALVPDWSPETLKGPFQIALKRPLELRLFRVGTTGFEPATP
jgi:hypothetical protein